MEVWRGDIIEVDLGVAVGSEQGGRRPALVVQNDVGNKYSPTTIVFPLTTAKKPPIPTHGMLYASEVKGLPYDSTFLAEHPRSLDKTRIKSKLGHLSYAQMAEVDVAICVSFGVRMQREDRNVSAQYIN